VVYFFFPLEIKKTTFLLKFLKSREGQDPLCPPLPTPMMSIHRGKISKDKQKFIERMSDRFGGDPRCLQLLFLSNADKFC